MGGELGNLVDVIAEDIYLHQIKAICQGVHTEDLIVIHINVTDIVQLCQIIDVLDHIVGTVDGAQGTILRPVRQHFDKIVGEVLD